jgi:hypothetical protein
MYSLEGGMSNVATGEPIDNDINGTSPWSLCITGKSVKSLHP